MRELGEVETEFLLAVVALHPSRTPVEPIDTQIKSWHDDAIGLSSARNSDPLSVPTIAPLLLSGLKIRAWPEGIVFVHLPSDVVMVTPLNSTRTRHFSISHALSTLKNVIDHWQ